VIADQNQNSDLFWALRGGGAGSFGVVTSVTLKISPVPQTVSLMRFEWADGAKALPVWERFLLDNFNNEKLTPQGYTNSKGGARANVFYVGPLVELQRLVAPLKAAGPTVSLSEKSVPYMSIVHQFGGCKDPATVAANDPTNCMNFAATTPKANPGTASTQEKQSPWVAMSAYVSKEIGANGWAAIMSKLKTLPGIMIIIDPHGAKINSVPADATSYSHRGALYHFQIMGYFEQEAARAGRQNSVQALYEFVVQLGVTSGSYINYSNEAMLQKPNWGRLYYGSGFERLQQIKAKYDPGNVFRHKFSIPVPGGSAPEVQPSQPSAPTTGSGAVNVPSCNSGEPAVFSLVEVASGANPRLPTRVTVCTEGPALRVDFSLRSSTGFQRLPAKLAMTMSLLRSSLTQWNCLLVLVEKILLL
jgi:FAD/FMN-containing dehydrogenase